MPLEKPKRRRCAYKRCRRLLPKGASSRRGYCGPNCVADAYRLRNSVTSKWPTAGVRKPSTQRPTAHRDGPSAEAMEPIVVRMLRNRPWDGRWPEEGKGPRRRESRLDPYKLMSAPTGSS
jgi:hypothetical protein